MRKSGIGPAAVLALVIAGVPVSAQTTVNNHAYVSGTSDCRNIVVEVHQQQEGGGTVTTLSYTVKRCPSGSTEPTEVVVQRLVTIPNGDYKVSPQQHALLTRTADGLVQLTWKPTQDQQTSFSGSWTYRTGASTKRKQEDGIWSTAKAEGSVVGFNVTPEFSSGSQPAWLSAETKTDR